MKKIKISKKCRWIHVFVVAGWFMWSGCASTLPRGYFPGILEGSQYQLAYYPNTGQSLGGSTSPTTDSNGDLIAGTSPGVTGGSGAGSEYMPGTLAMTEGGAPTGKSNTDELYADSTQHGWGENSNNGTTEFLAADSKGTVEKSLSFVISSVNSTLLSTGRALQSGIATSACHFTKLSCVDSYNNGTCTTAPSFNVYANTNSTEGTAVNCSNTNQTTLGTFTSQSETLAIPAGDAYGIYVSTASSGCNTSMFSVVADIVCP